MLFAEVAAAWYGPRWRQIAPPALRRSRRTIARWAADDRRVPRRVWLHFTPEAVAEKRRAIDRRAGEEIDRIARLADDQKSNVNRMARLVEYRIKWERGEGRPKPRGRPRAIGKVHPDSEPS
jgi:hypothetical protein